MQNDNIKIFLFSKIHEKNKKTHKFCLKIKMNIQKSASVLRCIEKEIHKVKKIQMKSF